MNVVISAHALARAKQRYGLVCIDADVVHRDITEGLLAGRGGKEHPNGTGYRCFGNAIYVWTPSLNRIYIVVPFTNRAGRTHLAVRTALPGVYRADGASWSRRRAA